MRARLATFNRRSSECWDHTSGPDIADTYQVAWAREDPAIAEVEQRMAAQIRDRYGIDVATVDSAAVRAEVARAENTRSEAGKQRTVSAAEQAQAQILIAHADREDQRADETREAAGQESDPQDRADGVVDAGELELRAAAADEVGRLVYDSAERRDATVRDLEAKGISQASHRGQNDG